jgi:ABC-2 type transport system permease protein
MMFILIPSMVLSGFIFPLESMPAIIRPITYLIPLRYIVIIVRSVFMKGSGFAELWPQFAALAVYGAVAFGAALSRFQKRLAD